MSDQKSDPYVQYLHAEWNLHRSDVHRAAAVRNTVKENRIRRVLDAGAGAGQEMQPVIEDGRALGVGLDIAPAAGSTGRELYRSQFPDARASFVRGTIERLPFLDETFDLVICRLALPYADNRCAVREIARVLVPDGRFLVKLHHPRYYVRQLRRNVLDRDPIAAVNSIRVLVNGIVFTISGVQPRNRWLGRETAQTRSAFLAYAEKCGLHLVAELPDSNSHTPSLHLKRTRRSS